MIIRKILPLIGLSLIVCNLLYAQAIKNCDLAIGFDKPLNNEVFPYGDTAKFVLYFLNNGPDTITTNDTVFFSFSGIEATLPHQEIVPGDTAKLQVAEGYSDGMENDTITYWAKILPYATTYTQTNQQNDSTSVTFVMLGNGDTRIGFAGVTNKHELKVYPNPGKDFITLSGKGWPISNSNCTVRIYNILGAMILEKKNINLEAYRLNVSDLASGAYFVVVSKVGLHAVQYFIKE